MIELDKIYNDDCLNIFPKIEDNSIDVILTDPPYLYLKNQRLERPFDEVAFFSHSKRVLKNEGFLVFFWARRIFLSLELDRLAIWLQIQRRNNMGKGSFYESVSPVGKSTRNYGGLF